MVSRDDPAKPFLGSMGIYMFNTQALCDVLEQNAFDDFGGQVIPFALQQGQLYGFDFTGYWEDIGTMRSFYETNLALADPNPRFTLYDPTHPIYSHARFLPGSIIDNGVIEHVLLAEGSWLKRCEIRHSVVGLRSMIRSGSVILDTVMMGSDYYDQGCGEDRGDDTDTPCIGIGRDCFIQGAIIDKNARIGRNVVIKPFPRGTDLETDNWTVQDGITVVPKNAIILPGTVIGPKTVFDQQHAMGSPHRMLLVIIHASRFIPHLHPARSSLRAGGDARAGGCAGRRRPLRRGVAPPAH